MSLELGKIQWQKMVAPYTEPSLWRSIWQLVNTLVPYALLWGLMRWTLDISYWLTLLLAIPAAGFLVRTFILFHDCCHGSFFKSRQANEIVGMALGVLAMTPFHHWRHEHNVHHATAGNLDKRGTGDVPTWTVQEYLAAPWWKRAGYRILRNPVFLFTVASSYVFLLAHRVWSPKVGKQERLSVHMTNFAMLGLFFVAGWFFGYKETLMVQLPISIMASSAGVWMFYVQHQFDGVYWEYKEKWEFAKAGLMGSSFYKLPSVLNWISGNIGFHHIHHLSPKIPNYFLPKCHKDNPDFQIKPLTLLGSFHTLRLALYDEATRQLVGFDVIKKYRQQMAQ